MNTPVVLRESLQNFNVVFIFLVEKLRNTLTFNATFM